MAPQKTKEMCPVGRITFMVQTETGSEEDNSQRAGLARVFFLERRAAFLNELIRRS